MEKIKMETLTFDPVPWHMTLLVMSVWRITNMLSMETGPAGILEIFRFRLGCRHIDYPTYKQPVPGSLCDLILCPYCLSVWVALLHVLGYVFSPLGTIWLMSPFWISAGAILFRSLVSHARIDSPK